jgi:homoserine O-acetyltransferase/O-succinyltransferase
LETFELGNFRTTTGYTLPDAKLTYKTHGALNAARDNAIVFPHFLGGSPEALEMWIGDGRALDPNKYFIILPGQFGNGTSTSPSNSAPPYDRGGFPPVRFADDVIAQHRLVTEQFDIQEVQLVLGWSTGALQIYEWAVRYASMVKRVASIAGAPRPSPWTRLWLRTALEEPITADPNWNRGFYADARHVGGGLRRMAHCTALTLPPHAMFTEGKELYKTLGFSSVEDFVSRFWEAFWLPQDPNNLLVQIRKALAADPSPDGDLERALAGITAKTLVVAFTGDPMFPPDECRIDADRIPNATFQQVPSVFGHLATFALSEQDVRAVDGALRTLLSS